MVAGGGIRSWRSRATLQVALLATFVSVSSGLNSWNRPSNNSPCPASIDETGQQQNNWTFYRDVNTALLCDYESMLLDFTVLKPLDDPSAQPTAQARKANSGGASPGPFNPTPGSQAQHVTFQEGWKNGAGDTNTSQVTTLISDLRGYLSSSDQANTTVVFGHYGNASVGVYVGDGIDTAGFAAGPMEDFQQEVASQGVSQTLLWQWCGDNHTSDITAGVVVDTTPGLAGLVTVQKAVVQWMQARCATDGLDGSKPASNTSTVWLNPLGESLFKPLANDSSALNQTSANSTTHWRPRRGSTRVDVRATSTTCSTASVASGDTCTTLAKKCGITGAQFDSYNTQSGLCSSLQAGQHVCCSSGTLPNFSPKPNSDGSCHSYVVQPTDTCNSLEATYGLTQAQLNQYNTQTWGWNPCGQGYLYNGTIICLSSGSPPMPSQTPGLECGPAKPGATPISGVPLSALNPCPLNACCDMYGFCGTTAEFCTNTTTGNPGTAKNGTISCISNCGTSIIVGKPPSEWMSVGYFEAWNAGRPCLWMDPGQIDTSKFTHIHFAFARLDSSFNVDVSYVQDMFDAFVQLKGVKKILSFGGWSDSTSPDTFMNIRNAVLPANQKTAAQNIANFAKKYGFDGVDIDWEYPGEQDIPGIPAASTSDGDNYLGFLVALRSLTSGMTLSIATPASFWYLQNFPIAYMAATLDYIIYMTYDLHGQWDYGNQYSDPGCTGGNCLRSHVNLTETVNALAMITKAGVPSNKIIVGVSSYGRSFAMTTPGCWGPDCTYEGPTSQAKPGFCTQTAGYISNAEINQILATDHSAVHYVDTTGGSDIVVYGGNQWVSYMTDETKAGRVSAYKLFNMGGTTDWAVDLAAFVGVESENPDLISSLQNQNGTCSWKYPAYDCTNSPGNTQTVLTMTREQRWDGVGADCAWRALIQKWTLYNETNPEAKQNFSSYASLALSGPETFDCGDVYDMQSSCSQFGIVQCNGNFDTNVSGPAGAIILSSFTRLNSAFSAFWHAIDVNKGQLSLLVNKFADTFYPPSQSELSEMFLNIAGMAFAVALPAVFDGVLEDLESFKDIDLATYPWIGIETHDVLSGGDNGDLAVDSFLELSEAWQAAISDFLTKIFSGSEETLPALYNAIAKGQQLDGTDYARQIWTAAQLEIAAQAAIVALAVPAAWAEKSFSPVVLTTGLSCDKTTAYDNKYFDKSESATLSVCVDDQLYFVAGAAGQYLSEEACTCQSLDGCQSNVLVCNYYFTMLPGTADLKDEDSGWAVSLEQLVQGAVNTAQHPGKVIDPANNADDLSSLINPAANGKDGTSPIDITAPGVVTIPACQIDAAFNHWSQGGKPDSPNYPCPLPEF